MNARPRTTPPALSAESVRSNPAETAVEGDERIRTAVQQCCTSESNYTIDSGGFQDVHRGGYIYFLRDVLCEGPIKVGYSADPDARCRQINRSLKHDSLSVLAAFPGTRDEEKDLHRRWARYRVIGEWFRPADEVLRAIELCRVLHGRSAA